MKKISNNKDIFICAFFAILACLFPFTGTDYTWALAKFPLIEDFFSMAGGYILPSLFTFISTKFLTLKFLFYGILIFIVISLIRSTINKKNSSLPAFAFFLIMLIDPNTFAANIANLTNFYVNVFSTISLLSFYSMLTRKSLLKHKWYELLLYGFFCTLISPLVNFIILPLSLYYIYKEGNDDSKNLFLLLGETVGSLITVLNTKHIDINFMHDLFYNLIPNIKGSNIAITMILTIFILVESIKVWKDKHEKVIILPSLGMVAFIVISFLDIPAIIYYLGFIAYLISSWYILMSTKKRRYFKLRINYWILFKAMYLLLVVAFDFDIEKMMLFPLILDITMITVLYDIDLPKNFLSNVWTILAIVLIISDMYIYKVVDKKYTEMNEEIKKQIEANSDCLLSDRYNIPYLYDYVPYDAARQKIFIDYYHVDPYIPNKVYTIKFKN